ncbi:phosphoribosyl transferase [Candidatus Berkelbacteria bacterium]|nr:phosphoribosyl transferase [Candidatus Berkelbacteria bacterium]
MHFVDRQDAGEKLAKVLMKYRGDDTVVYALPRGGVVVGFQVAHALQAPLDCIIARKIGHPANPEYAVCAVTEAGTLLCDESERALLDHDWFAQAVARERQEAVRRRKLYLGGKPHISAKNRRAILVDDGVATGLTMRSAVQSLRNEQPRELIVACPVAPHEVLETLRQEADAVIALEDARDYLGAVGAYYDDFPQVADDEVIHLLRQSRRSPYP